ncbi:MAG: FKBP-type peptidyl-prolyl cis-trans isomerase [Paludibacteraceae bacterium]|nr:FKBP-type peptidyl-prolyl cis-trans isomerase [Paludibacteraceae bacterium]
MNSKRTLMFLAAVVLTTAACHRTPPQIPSNKPTDNVEAEQMLRYNQMCIEAEQKEIATYIDSLGKGMTETEDGFWMRIDEPGTGDSIRKDDQVRLLYSLELLDGSICDDSSVSGAKTLRVGARQDIKALDLALPKLKRGSEATLLVPSYLAYGVPGDRHCVPSRCPIVLRLKVQL